MTKARDLANIISGGFTADDIPNIDASKITTGTFADARISNSSVSQHATSFDDNKLVNDISTLALRQASDQNKSAYNTNSQSVDVFQDDTGIDTETNTARDTNEFVTSSITTTQTSSITLNNSNYTTYIDINDDDSIRFTRYGSGATSNDARFNPSGANTAPFASGSSLNPGNFVSTSNEPTLMGYMFATNASNTAYLLNNDNPHNNIRLIEHVWKFKSGVTFKPNGTTGFRYVNGASGASYFELRGINHLLNTPHSGGQWGDVALGAYNSGMSNQTSYTFNVSNSNFYQVLAVGIYYANTSNSYMWDSLSIAGDVSAPTTTISTTGNFTGTTITAPSSVSEMGAIITYQDNAGTNALNTDIVLQLSADGGSNYSTATLTALPDFSTGIKMAKVNDLAVTAGTQLKYKISFANQASGSKEARIRGVALQY